MPTFRLNDNIGIAGRTHNSDSLGSVNQTNIQSQTGQISKSLRNW